MTTFSRTRSGCSLITSRILSGDTEKTFGVNRWLERNRRFAHRDESIAHPWRSCQEVPKEL